MKLSGCNTGEDEPDWAHRAKYIDHKPEYIGLIPKALHELGQVFFPIPRGEKGYSYPHSMDEYRYCADSEVLNAYLEQGWGYGVACAGDLAVIDIDILNYDDEIISDLPDTLWQLSGSGEGKHYFYYVEGLDTRQTLYDEFLDDRVHIGEVKCDPHGYVVGPGSVHPSGNKYGPLNGDKIASVSKGELMEAIEEFNIDTTPTRREVEWDSYSPEETHEFYELGADDVLPMLAPGERIAHPVHGSQTGMNFMKNENEDTFICWRCQYGSGDGCGLNANQFLACEATGLDCDQVRRLWDKESTLHYRAWIRAVRKGLVGGEPPYRAIKGYAIKEEIIEDDAVELYGDKYYMAKNMLSYEAEMIMRSS